MHLVRAMKKYGDVSVANAMSECGYWWANPRRRPTNVERMVMGLPRCALVCILQVLEGRKK